MITDEISCYPRPPASRGSDLRHSSDGTGKIQGGSPQISAYIAGTNEFSPGQDATITVVIQNSGTAAVFIDQGTLPQADLPTTAKLVTVGLSSGGAPINITTDPRTWEISRVPG